MRVGPTTDSVAYELSIGGGVAYSWWSFFFAALAVGVAQLFGVAWHGVLEHGRSAHPRTGTASALRPKDVVDECAATRLSFTTVTVYHYWSAMALN